MNTARHKATPLQHPNLAEEAAVFAELATAFKSGTLQGAIEYNAATGLFDRLMPPQCSECGHEKYMPMARVFSALFLVRDHLRRLRANGRGTALPATIERAKPLRKASRAKA